MTAPATALKTRIVGHGEEPPDQLLANPLNFRRHPGEQMDALRGSLKDFGWVRSVLVNRRTGHVVDGHARVEEALRQGLTLVPVEYIDVSEEEERGILTILDPITGMAVQDQAALDALVSTVLAEKAASDDHLRAMIASLASTEIAPEEIADEDAVPEEPAVPVTQRGEIVVMGNHVLICGDCKDASTWDALLDGKQVDAVWTDPPYGVNLKEKGDSMAKYQAERRPGWKASDNNIEIANDDLSPEQLEGFLRDTLGMACAHTKPGGVWYVAAPNGPLFLAFGRVLLDLGIWRQTLAWVKQSLVFGRSDYHYRHEAIFFGWRPGAAHQALEDRTQDTVWEISSARGPNATGNDHPTVKPVALIERALLNHTKPHDVVLDCFGGSGSTLIACEKHHRHARLIEVAPGYCDVIVRRWEEATKRKAERFPPTPDAGDTTGA